ncbi:MAG: urease accessory protein UreD [Nitrosopumilaceae archaeon]
METSQISQTNELIHGGMDGFANIELESDKNSKTFIKKLKTKSPILVQKALYNDFTNPDKAHIYLMSSAGGMLQGDTLKIDIHAKDNTNAFVTTQAATKIYKAENRDCRQYINILVDKDSFLEFLPKQIIPHKDSKFLQEVNVSFDKSSTLLYSEIISSGRIAHGEKFDFDSIRMRFDCKDKNGKILFSESSKFEPKNNKTKFNSLFGNQNLYCTIYIISQKIDSDRLTHNIYDFIKTNYLIGCSQLPNNSGVVIRILSNSIDEINDLISTISNFTYVNLSEKIQRT